MKKRHDVEGLLEILDTGDIKECRESIRMLGELRSRKAILPLIGFLETDDIQIRSNAAWALGEIGHIKAVLPLIGILNDPIDNVRINAAWSLGRIGDKRAVAALRSAMRNGSIDLRKHAREAIARIESTEADKRHGLENEPEEPDFSNMAVSLLTLAVPSDMDCNYLSRVEDEASQTDFLNTTQFSRDVLINDTGNFDVIPDEELRKIIMGLRKGSTGSVSIDVLFRFKNDSDDNKTSSVWLHVSTNDKSKRRISDTGKKKSQIKYVQKAKPVEHEIPQEYSSDEEEFEETQEPDHQDVYEKSEAKIKPVEAKLKVKPVIEPVKPVVNKPEPLKPEVKTSEPKPEVKVRETKPELETEPVRESVKIGAMPEIVPPQVKPVTSGMGDVNSAVQLLSNIGMSGMTKAASAVTQLSGEEEGEKHSQLRTLPVDELKDEILSLGDSVVMVSVILSGKGPSGDVNGEMQIYISNNDALDVANELLCNTPQTYVKEFNDDISSTLKEMANIFGGQYVSAISEYIGVPFLLNVPTFKNGKSSQIAESAFKDIGGKVDFVLATNLAFGPNKVGRLIMLLDPASFETIIKKLF